VATSTRVASAALVSRGKRTALGQLRRVDGPLEDLSLGYGEAPVHGLLEHGARPRRRPADLLTDLVRGLCESFLGEDAADEAHRQRLARVDLGGGCEYTVLEREPNGVMEGIDVEQLDGLRRGPAESWLPYDFEVGCASPRSWCETVRRIPVRAGVVPTTLSARRYRICQRNSRGEIDVSPDQRYAGDHAGETGCRVMHRPPPVMCSTKLDRSVAGM
jgi:hypothetical protein